MFFPLHYLLIESEAGISYRVLSRAIADSDSIIKAMLELSIFYVITYFRDFSSLELTLSLFSEPFY